MIFGYGGREITAHQKLIMHPSEIREPNMAFIWGGLSTALFFTTNVILRFVVPKGAAKDVHQRWKWRNTANSFLHSSITGFWSLFCVWEAPEIRQDLIYVYTYSAHAALSISAGYFVYDLVDMMASHRKRSSFELMIHHVLVILCFGLAITTCYFLGFCIVGLMVEVNSVFLHARQLMHIQNVDRTNTVYRINCFLNIGLNFSLCFHIKRLFTLFFDSSSCFVGTFIVFRILTLGALTIWIFQFKNELTTIAYLFGVITLPTIFVMNIILFLRILNTDFMKQPSRHTKLRQLFLHETEDWKAGEKEA